MNWSPGAISIRSGQSGQLRELISAPASAKPTPPLLGRVRQAYRSCPLQFGGGGPASFKPDQSPRFVRRIDDEDSGVVHGVVLSLAARSSEVQPEMEPAVGERRSFDGELQRQRPRRVAPPELLRARLPARDEHRRIVSQ